ncbi:MAG: caspase family protein [Acidobacteriota bacterium]
MSDPACIFLDQERDPEAPGTHALILGVGEYAYGKGRGQASEVAGDLRQLSSPPLSARAMADWFLGSFRNSARPLASLSLLLSEETPTPYRPSRGSPAAVEPGQPQPRGTYANVRAAAIAWAKRLRSHKDNLGVFYFCGHGASSGQLAALLLEDFGDPDFPLDHAVDVDGLRGGMKNSPAVQQVYLFDCCRSNVDALMTGGQRIGSRLVTELPFRRGHRETAQQFVLFPTLDGEEAYGVPGEISLFSRSVIDALSFAAARLDDRDRWWTDTTGLHEEISRLIEHRVPEELRGRSRPNALDSTRFTLNEIDEPTRIRSFVTISRRELWPNGLVLGCSDAGGGGQPAQEQSSEETGSHSCCTFDLERGRWRFSGSFTARADGRQIEARERHVTPPVEYITLEVLP